MQEVVKNILLKRCHNNKRNLHLQPLWKFVIQSRFHNLNISKVNTLSYKTRSVKKSEVDRQWFLIDGEGEVVGRLATQIATILRGKHKPTYTPHVDTGDNIIIINAEKVRFTGQKWAQKEYQRYSGYPGGQKRRTAAEMLEKKPIEVIEHAVRGMLPKNKLGRQMFKKLYVYTGGDHPHAAQKPETLNS